MARQRTLYEILEAHELALKRLQATLARVSTSGVTDHGALTGLADDDHTQYLKDTGDVSTGHLTFHNSFGDVAGTLEAYDVTTRDLLLIHAGASAPTGPWTGGNVRLYGSGDISQPSEVMLYTGSTQALTVKSDGVVVINKTSTAAAPALVLDDDLDTGFYLKATNSIGFATLGLERMYLASGGWLHQLYGIRNADGAVGFPTYSFSSDTDTGAYLGADGQYAVATAGVRRFLIDSVKLQLNTELRFDGFADKTSPNINWVSDQNSGLYMVSAGVIGISINDNLRLAFGNEGLHTDYAAHAMPRTWFSAFGSKSPTSATTWQVIGTAWNKDLGTVRPVSVTAQVAAVMQQSSNGTSQNGRIRVGISTDGGSTWTYGASARIDDMSTAAGVNTRATVMAMSGVENATPTGNVHVRAEVYVSSTDMTCASADCTITAVGDTA